MITRVLAVGLLAGLLAGLIVATLQAYTTTPIILAAEVFERGAAAPPQGSSSLEATPRLYRDGGEEARVILVHDGEHHPGTGEATAAAWEPADGLERTFFTSIATVATAVGFALIILAGMLAAGDGIDERRAMAWAVAGFVATGLAPAVGLAPEVPGMAAADLAGRQEWWALTAIATAAAAWLFLRSDNAALRILAVVLLIAPHVWGAPQLVAEAHKSNVPAELAAQFAATSLAVQATLWVLTGFFVGFWWRRIGERTADQPGLR
jgi:cobalt transporter subunit CbtA